MLDRAYQLGERLLDRLERIIQLLELLLERSKDHEQIKRR